MLIPALIIIVIILLLGFATVRQWLGTVLLALLWFLVALGLGIGLAATFGETGAMIAFVLGCLILMALVVWSRGARAAV